MVWVWVSFEGKNGFYCGFDEVPVVYPGFVDHHGVRHDYGGGVDKIQIFVGLRLGLWVGLGGVRGTGSLDTRCGHSPLNFKIPL